MKDFQNFSDKPIKIWKDPIFPTPKKKQLRVCKNCQKDPAMKGSPYCFKCRDYRDTHSGMLPTTHYSVNSLSV